MSLGRMTRKERARFTFLLVVRSLTAILDIVGVVLVGIIGSIAAGSLTTGSRSSNSLFAFLPQGFASTENLLVLAAVTLGFFVLKAIIAIAVTRALTSFVAEVEQRAATALVSRILHGGLGKLQGWTPSELTYSVTISMNAAYGRLLSHFATVVTEGFLLICISIVLAVVSPVTMIVVVLYFGLIGYLIQVYVGRRQLKAGLALGVSTVDATTSLSETIGAYREIVTLGRQSYFTQKFGGPRAEMAETAGTVQFVQSLPRYIVESALLLGAVALIASQALSNNLSSAAATLAIFLTAGFRIMASLLPLQNAAGSIGQVSAEGDLAIRLLADYEDLPARPVTAEPIEQADAGMSIELRNVQFAYADAARPALTDIDFIAEPGEYCAIIGPSGAGKSTLADLLLGLIVPSSGTIALDGLTPSQIEVSRPGSIAYVPQRPGLVSGSIAQNVALGYDDEDIDINLVETALRQANLFDHVHSLPEGANTSVGKQSNALSGGQIQRLGLARALYAQPRLLVLDEATSALDAESESVVGDSLRALGGTVTLVVIAHRLSTVQHADTVHVMEEGRIIASGPFAYLLETVPLVARYAELMSLDELNP